MDDSSSILKVISRALTQKNYVVETADNGSVALDRLMSGYATIDFDVVLMDLQMPVMDGIEAARRYREFETAQRVIERSLSHLLAATAEGTGAVGVPGVLGVLAVLVGAGGSGGSDVGGVTGVTTGEGSPDKPDKTDRKSGLMTDGKAVDKTDGMTELQSDGKDNERVEKTEGYSEPRRLLIIGMSANSDRATEKVNISTHIYIHPYAYGYIHPYERIYINPYAHLYIQTQRARAHRRTQIHAPPHTKRTPPYIDAQTHIYTVNNTMIMTA